jgi:hypothetical protein
MNSRRANRFDEDAYIEVAARKDEWNGKDSVMAIARRRWMAMSSEEEWARFCVV